MVIGLTGGIGTGKTTVSKKLRERGYPVIDLDNISREVIKYSKVINKLVQNFGKEILLEEDVAISEREISRKKLGKIVFKDEKKINILNSIMHPPILKKMREEIKEAEKKYAVVFVEVQLLFEINLEQEFDMTVLVYSDRKTQLKRVSERDGRDEEEVLNILDSQMDIEIKRKKSSYIIENNLDLENLDREIDKFIEKLEILMR